MLLIYIAAISFSAAFSEEDNVLRIKRSIEYVPCERGWYYFHDKCYKAFAWKSTERLPWARAVERCRNYGGDLVSIQSQEEQDFIFSFLQLDVKSWIWIGLNDHDKESEFRWSDGSVYNYTNWKPGQPDGAGPRGEEENCVHMVFELNNNIMGKWNDRHCDVPDAYVCEKEPNHRKRSPNQMYCTSEAGKGLKFQNSCYHVVTETKSWLNAERYCQEIYNGHLVDILDTLEDYFLDYVTSDIKEELWIGIQTQNQLQQKWSSGWYVSYDGFDKEQLNYRQRTCIARKKRKEWIKVPCAKRLPFICEVSKVSPPALKLPAKGSHCPIEFDDWRDLGGEYCYYFETEKILSFYEAMFDCKRRGGNLVSLHSKEESDMLLPFVKYVRHYVFIGLFRLIGREEEFAWTDGSPVDYENWKSNEPNNLEEMCVEALTNDYPNGIMFTWNDARCEEKRGYICSVKKIFPTISFAEENGCRSFCIAYPSHLHEMVTQSTDAQRLP